MVMWWQLLQRRNSSLPLSPPVVGQLSGDSIRQPSDCELIPSLSGYCHLLAYCYRCHFSVARRGSLSACRCRAESGVFTGIDQISLSDKERLPCIKASVHGPFPHSLCLSFCQSTAGSDSYSWAICLGWCCVRCVCNTTSSVPLFVF